MKTLVSAIIVLCFAAAFIGCSDKAEKGTTNTSAVNYSEPVSQGSMYASADETPAATVNESAPEPVIDDSATGEAIDVSNTVTCLAKVGDALYAGGPAGVTAIIDGKPQRIVAGETSALLTVGDQLWIVQPGMLRTLDGATQIVPEFASHMTGAAAEGDDMYVATAGEGIFKLVDGKFEPASPEWDVVALAATDFGLFAATTDGLYSFNGDKWIRRTAVDSDAAPAALYYRYPYLYVGAGSELLRFDGGSWEHFALDPAAQISALGWHNARLYIGAEDGSLATLEGLLIESVDSPDRGAVHALLRYDGRLHVGTDLGLVQQRFDRFQKVDLEEPAKDEPKPEPIASLL